jgi:hypothetical protein
LVTIVSAGVTFWAADRPQPAVDAA